MPNQNDKCLDDKDSPMDAILFGIPFEDRHLFIPGSGRGEDFGAIYIPPNPGKRASRSTRPPPVDSDPIPPPWHWPPIDYYTGLPLPFPILPHVSAPAPVTPDNINASAGSSQGESCNQLLPNHKNDTHAKLTAKDMKELVSAVCYLKPYFPFEGNHREALDDYLWKQVVSLAKRRGACIRQPADIIKREVNSLLAYHQVSANSL
jgi:hypothetical protein